MHVRTSSATTLSDTERLNRLRLIRSDNIGPRTFRALIRHCCDAATPLQRLPELARRGGAARPGRICSEDEARAELEACKGLGVDRGARGRSRQDLPAGTCRPAACAIGNGRCDLRNAARPWGARA